MTHLMELKNPASHPTRGHPGSEPAMGNEGWRERACFCFLGRRVRVPQILGWLRSFVTLAIPSELPDTTPE